MEMVSMKRANWNHRNRAFTLLEIMIVVSFIGLLSVLAIPSFIKVRKQAQGKRILNDARVIDSAVGTWALEANKKDGDPVDVDGIASYIKAGKFNPNDVLNNPYGIGPVGPTQVQVSVMTKAALDGVGIDWGGY
jgi:prepilin-type N-terminal cleavage/methylation domain-containing protein